MKQRGCVVEVREKTLVLMTASCDFVEIPRRHAQVFPGMEIHFENTSRNRTMPVKWLAVAAMLVILIIGSVLMTPTTVAMAVYTASIDINPSLDILMDGEGSVLQVNPLNHEASVLDTRAMEGKPIEVAVSSIVEQLVHQGYFQGQYQHYLVFSLRATDPDWPEDLLEGMRQRMERSIQEEKLEKAIDLSILSFTVDPSDLSEAEQEALTLNQLLVKKQFQTMMGEEVIVNNHDEDNGSKSMESMIRSILREKEHPVFDQHPGADPGGPKEVRDDNTKPRESEEREHPVFDTHPGNRPNDSTDRQNEKEENKGGETHEPSGSSDHSGSQGKSNGGGNH